MKYSEPLIISIDKFRFYAGVSDSFDADFIAPLIIQATDALTERVLSTPLTAKLIADFNANSLAGVYLEIYPLIEKMVVWQAYYFGINRMYLKVANGQIVKGNNAQGSPVERQDVDLLKKEAYAQVLDFESRVKNFIGANVNRLPELAENKPEWIKASMEKNDVSMGLTWSQNRFYNDY